MDERNQGSGVARVVADARRRLSRISGRALLRQRAAWVFGVALGVMALRPVVWPLGDDAALWEGPVRAIGLGFAVLVVGLSLLVVVGRRRGPKALEAARAIDEVSGHPEVVASGFAFLSRGDEEPSALIALAKRRAEAAAAVVDVGAAFPIPALGPSRKRLALCVPLLVVAVAIGAYDPVRVAALLDPPTTLETEGASVLRDAAARVEAEANREERRPDPARERNAERGGAADEREPSLSELAERARRAADAARRGDRERALSELSEVGRAGRNRSAQQRELARTLSRLAASLAARSEAAGASRGAGDPSDALRLLSRETRAGARDGTPEAEAERQRTLERLSRAAEAMREEAERSGSEEARRAAEELNRAAEALSQGERQAAAEALERAAEASEAMEREREERGRQAEALARLMEASGLLERAVQLAMAGEQGEGELGELAMGAGQGEGEGAGEGAEGASQGASEGEMAALRRALAERLAAMGEGRDGQPARGPGGHIPDRGGATRDGLDVTESTRARSEVGEGERATQAVRGLGQNGEPTHAYREVFPSYGAIAEEAMADETVPPLRRDAVRRYFEGIRPGDGPDENTDENTGSP